MSMPVIVFADVVQLSLDYLRVLDGIPVAVKQVPDPRPGSFVTGRRIGGTRRTKVTDAALVAFECWAATDADAADLADLTLAYVLAMAGTVQAETAVYRVDVAGGPVDLPDPESDQPRYTFSVEIALRGHPPT